MSRQVAVQNTDAVIKDLGAETLLYIADTKTIHILNPTARLIWELCGGAHTVEEMETAIRSQFDVPQGHDVRQDIEQTLTELAQKGLIALVNA